MAVYGERARDPFRVKSADTSGTRKGSLDPSRYTATEEAAAALVRICRGHGVRLELEVEAQGFVELSHQVSGNATDHLAQAFDGHRPDLFGLRLGVESKARRVGW